jgi:zinc transporter, ZIP family
MRTGLFTALAIGIHNFPEGLATFGAALSNVKIGVTIAIAIAIHNIPEGISVSVPIFYATGDKKKAFIYSFLSGIAEPVGAAVGFLILLPFLSDIVIASLMGFVAGIMVYISLDELLPMAHRYGHSHIVIIGIMIGMFIMALSLLIL